MSILIYLAGVIWLCLTATLIVPNPTHYFIIVIPSVILFAASGYLAEREGWRRGR
jgi:hypothetical protein